MMEKDWNPADFRRMLFQLSGQNPIFGYHSHHPKATLIRNMHYEVELVA